MANNVVTKQALKQTLKQLQSLMAYLPNDNLLEGTGDRAVSASATRYFMEYPIGETLKDGEWVTFSAEVELDSNHSYMYLFNSTGWVILPTRQIKPDSSGRAVATFQWKTDDGSGHVAANDKLLVVLYPDDGSARSSYKCVKLERGKVATAWCESMAERLKGLQGRIDTVSAAVSDIADIISQLDDRVSKVEREASAIDLMTAAEPRVLMFYRVPNNTPTTIVEASKGSAPAGFQVLYSMTHNRFFALSGNRLYQKWEGMYKYGEVADGSGFEGGVIPIPGKLYISEYDNAIYFYDGVNDRLLHATTAGI